MPIKRKEKMNKNLKTTTIEIGESALSTWRSWCKAKNLNSVELMNAIINHVTSKRREELYKTLPMRTNYTRPLSDCKIDKKKITIEKRGSYNR